MFVSDCLKVNEKGHLTIGGCDCVELAREYGTPLYVMDENTIRENARAFLGSIDKNYNGNGCVAYASKAFSCKEIYRICKQEGLCADVVSGSELFTALSVDFPAAKIYFHGNNKTAQELHFALENGVGRIVVDNLTELERLNEIAGEMGKTADIMFRIKPGIDAHTHSFVKTGQIDSKFGLALENSEAMEGVVRALALPNIELRGLHCHIGSQIFDVEPFAHAAEVMMDFIAKIKAETGAELCELNLGGGFGIKYLEGDNPTPYCNYMDTVADVIKAKAQEHSLPLPFITIEPGRSIVGAAGVTLYEVGSVKEIENVRTYVSVDGGMADNPRYILYKSDYEILCANKANAEKDMTVTIAGRCCESGDLIQENAKIQSVEPGDIIAVLATGAYNYSMASNYNRLCKPPVVMIQDEKSRLIVKRETYNQIIQNDV